MSEAQKLQLIRKNPQLALSIEKKRLIQPATAGKLRVMTYRP